VQSVNYFPNVPRNLWKSMKIHSVVNTQSGIPSVIKIFAFDFDQNPVFVVHYVPGGRYVKSDSI